MKSITRPAFTLFQLMVILAILAILLALLLPAVQKVREAANRTQSMNNMKQLALAAHNYHDTNRAFPPGLDAKGFSASAYLLPYMEEHALFQTLDFKKPITDKANAKARAKRIKIFISPRDPVAAVNPDFGPTNYLWCAGSKPALKDNDGGFYAESKTGIREFVDGLSNTLMTAETLKGDGKDRAQDVHRQLVRLKPAALKGLNEDAGMEEWKDGKDIAGDRGASWMDGRFLQGTFTGTRMYNDDRPDVDCAGTGGLSGPRGLGPKALIGLCDGSVREASGQLKLQTWKALASRNGGEQITDPEY
jgi:type II secretory pathway pseudopilin PulG